MKEILKWIDDSALEFTDDKDKMKEDKYYEQLQNSRWV